MDPDEFERLQEDCHQNGPECKQLLKTLCLSSQKMSVAQLRWIVEHHFPSIDARQSKRALCNALNVLEQEINDVDYTADIMERDLRDMVQLDLIHVPVIASDGLLYDLSTLEEMYRRNRRGVYRQILDPEVRVAWDIRQRLEEFAYENGLPALKPMPLTNLGQPALTLYLNGISPQPRRAVSPPRRRTALAPLNFTRQVVQPPPVNGRRRRYNDENEAP